MRSLLRATAVTCLGGVILVLAACSVQTEPATNIMDDGVDLHAQVSWDGGESGKYWFEYHPILDQNRLRSGSSTTWYRTAERNFGPMPTPGSTTTITEKLRASCDDVDGPCTSTSRLQPSTNYTYRICGYLSTAPSGVTCFDSAGETGQASHYDRFMTLPAWDDNSHALSPCPANPSTTSTGWVCADPEPVSPRTHSDYSAHYTNTAHYGVGPFEYGSFLHQRDLVFNGRRAQIWQSGSVFSGPGLRYDFRERVYFGTSHSVADSFRNIEPEGSFSTGNIVAPNWFVLHNRPGPYHVHWRVYFRAAGRTNPSRPDGTFATPVTSTPYYRCELDSDGERICKFN